MKIPHSTNNTVQKNMASITIIIIIIGATISTVQCTTYNKVRLMDEPPRTTICFQNQTNGGKTQIYTMSMALWKNAPGLKTSQNATITLLVRHMVFSLKEYANCTLIPYNEGSLYKVPLHISIFVFSPS